MQMEHSAPLMDRRCRRTRQAVKEALIELMGEKEIARITISELAQRANVNRKTFYNHYSDIGAVVDELEEDLVGSLASLLERQDLTQVMENPYPILLKMAGRIQENWETFRLLVESGEHVHMNQKLKESMNRYLSDALQKRLGTSSKAVAMYIDFMAEGIASLYHWWVKAPECVTVDELCQFVCIMLCGGGHALRVMSQRGQRP